jgi:hypothetical protein
VIRWYLHNAREWWWLDWRAPSEWKMAWQKCSWRISHSQDLGPRLLGGICEGPECYLLRPEAHERIPSGTLWASHSGDLTWCWQPYVPDTTPKLQDVIAAARPEFKELTEYRDIFAMKSEDCGWTDRVYHRIDMGEARPIPQPLSRFP